MNKDVKDLGKESATSHSMYDFLMEDWMKNLLDKPVKEEGVTMDRDELEAKDIEELDKEGS